MEVEILSKDDKKGKLSFAIRGTTPAFANALRRTIAEEVPVLAIEDVEFRENSSALYDEVVAHRLGLVPIKTDLKSYEIPAECSCKGEGCAKCTLKMTLSSKKAGYVYAEEIKSKDPKCRPVYDKMPITKLLKGQEIEFEATAVLGHGKEHMKWSPGLAFYKNYPIIEINQKGESCEDAAIKCPVKVFEFKKGKLAAAKPLKCTFCNACAELCPEGIKVEGSKTDFIFDIESWGQLDADEMVKEAANILQKKTDEFVKLLK